MNMGKSKREIIKLVSSKTKHYYTTTKKKTANQKKIQLKKYDPIIKKHVLYSERKIK